MRRSQEIADFVSSGGFQSDVMKSSMMEFYPRMSYSALPEFFKKFLNSKGMNEKEWNKGIDTETEEDIKEAIVGELDEVKLLFFEEKKDSEARSRFPRVLALLWIYGLDVSALAEESLNLWKGKHPNKVLKNLIKEVEQIVL